MKHHPAIRGSADEWMAHVDPVSQRKYYYNSATGESRWQEAVEGTPVQPKSQWQSRPDRRRSFHAGATATSPMRASLLQPQRQQRVVPHHPHAIVPINPLLDRSSFAALPPLRRKSSVGLRNDHHYHQHLVERLKDLSSVHHQGIPATPLHNMASAPAALPSVHPLSNGTRPRRNSVAPNRHRAYESIKKDLLKIHRRQSIHGISTNNSSAAVHGDGATAKDTVPLEITTKAAGSEMGTATVKKQRAGDVIEVVESKVHEGQLTKDYVGLAKAYRKMELYRVRQAIATATDARDDAAVEYACLLCKEMGKIMNKVFFPCEHRCVCDDCVRMKNIPVSFRQCPLCREEIKIALDHTGREREQYWSWVEEVKPYIPSSFLQNFKYKSGIALAKVLRTGEGEAGVDNGSSRTFRTERRRGNAKSRACVIS